MRRDPNKTLRKNGLSRERYFNPGSIETNQLVACTKLASGSRPNTILPATNSHHWTPNRELFGAVSSNPYLRQKPPAGVTEVLQKTFDRTDYQQSALNGYDLKNKRFPQSNILGACWRSAYRMGCQRR